LYVAKTLILKEGALVKFGVLTKMLGKNWLLPRKLIWQLCPIIASGILQITLAGPGYLFGAFN